ncbi:MAG TPA: amino acid permease [Solirubrobacterales bacterium]|nr:amino acid permease [Solirubrobacterales bacterium]
MNPRAGFGVPAIFAIALGAAGSSIYFILGVVADDALGLTPLVFLLAAAFFVITMMSYVEGNALHPERGGASTFARYAFNELWSFVAGWAIILDYLIVIAMGSFAIAHYLAAFVGAADDKVTEHVIAGAAIAWVALSNIRGLSAGRYRFVLRLGLVNLVLAAVIVVIGAVQVFQVSKITDSIDLGSAPSWDDLLIGAVIATVALTGIEAASGLAGELRMRGPDLRRLVVLGTVTVMVWFVAISITALMALPVHGAHTALGDSPALQAPVLGVVSTYSGDFLRHLLRYLVGGTAALVLATALNGQMLGLSRLAYSLATNRQIPSAVGKLHGDRSTPYIAIIAAALLAFVLVLTMDIKFLAGLFAYGAMLTFAIAHLGIVALRFREPDFARAFEVPLSVQIRRRSVPIPSVLGALLAFLAWISVLVLHSGARYVGSAWMVGGLALYVVYRKSQGKSLRRRFTIPAAALHEPPEVEYGSILVPVFGGPLDDDIMGTAGRLASEEGEPGEGGTVIEALYVLEVPMSLPLDARVPDDRIGAARRALARAKEVGEEYEGVEVATAVVRARSVGAGIVEEARRRGVDAIVVAAEQPTRVRGGALLGGRGGPRERFVGETTRYIVEKAPCRVILTAAPAGEAGVREGVAP